MIQTKIYSYNPAKNKVLLNSLCTSYAHYLK